METRYKYCIVPKCTNTSYTTPDKVFVSVPRIAAERRIWCLAMKRDDNKNPSFSEKSCRHVCEDHFDLQNDMENYFRYKLLGGRVYLKKGVVPHIFECQKPVKVAASTERASKRQRVNAVIDLLHNAPQPSSSTYVPPVQDEIIEVSLTCDKATQVHVKTSYRSKSTNTVKIITVEVGCSSVVSTADASCGTLPTEEHSVISYSESDSEDDNKNEDSEYECVAESDSDFEMELDNSEANHKIRGCMVVAVEKQSFMCLGIPQHITFLIEFLAIKIKCPPLHILITLKKLRMDDAYAYLAMLFGMSTSNIVRIFQKTVYRLASLLQNFIIWPNQHTIKRCLPIAFRARYGDTQSIIDCFEIKIEKPSNPVHQSLTWSEYKKSNTLKYLISCTPDGTVSFVSRGYGGRASDTVIFEDSGYMESLIPDMDVMADRGFKNVAHFLTQKSCELIRPPSVCVDQPMTTEEVKASKRIAALRIHIERVIGRLKFFAMCAPDACVDHNHLQVFDHVVVVVCGLINLQPELIRS